MGNATHQQAQAFHLLRLPHLFFNGVPLRTQSGLFQAFLHRKWETLEMFLEDIVIEAHLHALGSNFFVACIRNHDDRQLRKTLSDRLEYLQAIRPLQLIIDEHHIEVRLSHRLLQIRSLDHLPTRGTAEFLLQFPPGQFAVIRAVINNEKTHASPHLLDGSSIQKLLPCPGTETTPTRPPIISTALRTVASPKPIPGYSSAPWSCSKGVKRWAWFLRSIP